jgi:lysozyme family protein
MSRTSFEAAYKKVIGNEGGYSNDRVDRGGETYRGVSRAMHPTWIGWGLIDASKADGSFPKNLSQSQILRELVEDFYHAEFWVPLQCDQINSQSIAEELFDTAVNVGHGPAVRFLQRGLNCLNRNGVLYDDVPVDGRMGRGTLTALDALLDRDESDELLLLKIMNILQGAHYVGLMERDATQERFARGWLGKRVSLAV